MHQGGFLMVLHAERERLVEYGKRISQEKLSTGTSGNLSIYNAEEGLMAITPSGMSYFEITPEDIVVMDLENHIVDSKRKPSSEWALHTVFYKNKPDIRAVVHTHPVYSTIFAILNKPLKAVHYAIADAGVDEVPCAPYHLFGTVELAEEAIKACGNSKAVLLANHGLLTCGKDLESAYGLTCNMEFVAELQYRSMSIGTPVILNGQDMKQVLEKFMTYGQPGGKKGY